MKKSKFFISIILAALSVAGCSCDNQEQHINPPTPTPTPAPTPDPEPDPEPEPNPDISDGEKKLEKTKMNYTYSDYMDNFYRTYSAIPNAGAPKILVFPVYFNDSSSFIPVDKKDVVKSDIEKCFSGTKDDCGFESVTSYYSTLSMNKCNLDCKVLDWVDVPNTYVEYAFEINKTIELINYVVDDYFAKNTDEKRTDYDLDQNGFLDGIVLIYGAPDTDNTESRNNNLWAYTSWNTSAKRDVENPDVCNFFWASYDFMYSKSTAHAKLGNNYASGDGSNDKLLLDTHVFIHEMGHMFGLQDYYDYSYQYSPSGGFSMQDYNVASHDAFSTLALGWADPYIPKESCTIELNSFQSSRDCILLSNQWNDINSPFDEYILLEFYTPDGLNQFDYENQYFKGVRGKVRPVGPSESGIRLWHVDARLLSDPYMRDAGKITVDPKAKNGICHAMSNTYYETSGKGRDYISVLGQSYANYNILQLIRCEETETYKTKNYFDNFSLFKDGSSFSMSTFSKQFVNKARLNTNKVLGWNFKVKIEGEKATITLLRTI
ncbi:MAG: hypothetical protein J6T15_02015 [Bacilli bacterium]|nr:hypothetical protein [Bacilli bacterium]